MLCLASPRTWLLVVLSLVVTISCSGVAFGNPTAESDSSAALGSPGAEGVQPTMRLSGSFLQIDGQMVNWSRADWQREFAAMHEVGMDLVVVQYAGYGDTWFYPAPNHLRQQKVNTSALADEAVHRMVWQAGNAQARYVTLRIMPGSAAWTMLAEVEVITGNNKNVALNKAYTLKPAPSVHYPDHQQLTDGSAPFAWSGMVGFENPNQPIELQLDLGESVAINQVNVTFMRSKVSAVELPAAVEVALLDTQQTAVAKGQASWEGLGAPSRPALTEPSEPDTLGAILDTAASLGMQVMLGLHLDPDFWSGVWDTQTDLARNQALVDDLWQRYGKHPAFAGWYIPHELSDYTFAEEGLFRLSLELMPQLVTYIHQVSPGLPVAIAPYYGRTLGEAAYRAKWTEFLDHVPVDIIALQDGVGTHRVDVSDITPHFRAVQAAIGDKPIQLWSDVEIFDQIHGWPVDNGTWAAIPAQAERVRQQLTAAAPYVTRSIAFEFAHYMSPRLPQGRALYDAYRALPQ